MNLPQMTPQSDEEPDPPKPFISKLFGFVVGVFILLQIIGAFLRR